MPDYVHTLNLVYKGQLYTFRWAPDFVRGEWRWDCKEDRHEDWEDLDWGVYNMVLNIIEGDITS